MTDHDISATIPVPTVGVDERTALATAIHAGPGVYAVLAGSGMSSAAGIPTGWQVVQDLIRTIATAEGVAPDEIGDVPEEWWARQGRPEPRYDTILPALATTDAARQALLRTYFDPPAHAGGPIRPTTAHKELASLCASGRVRLIVTTNFDRLIERALDAVGVTPQVITNPEALAGMIPLPHADCTVIKLHGDYAIPGMRNSPDELSTYPKEWNDLLDQVFDQYGLLVVGWSAEYDIALGQAMERAPNHRYPVFWTSHEGRLTEPAGRLIAMRKATVIDTASADEFFADITGRLDRLDQVAARRGRPAILRTYLFPPETTTAPQGWAVLPLLQLTTVAAVGQVALEKAGRVRQPQREAILNALRLSPTTTAIRNFTLSTPATASVDRAGDAAPLVDWEPTPGGLQTTDHASYRLGGDASSGVSALTTIAFPRMGLGASVVFKLHVAVSIDRPLRLGEVARYFRDALVLMTGTLPESIGDQLPPDASVFQAEIFMLAANTDGNSKNRPNQLTDRIDLTPLGTPTRSIDGFVGCGARISQPLTEHESAELVVEGFEEMAYDRGFLDPRIAISLLRQELGLPGGTT